MGKMNLVDAAIKHANLLQRLASFQNPPLTIDQADFLLTSMREQLKKEIEDVKELRVRLTGFIVKAQAQTHAHARSSKRSSMLGRRGSLPTTTSSSSSSSSSTNWDAETMRFARKLFPEIQALELAINNSENKITAIQTKITNVQICVNDINHLYYKAFMGSKEYPHEMKARQVALGLQRSYDQLVNALCEARGVSKHLKEAVAEAGKAWDVLESRQPFQIDTVREHISSAKRYFLCACVLQPGIRTIHIPEISRRDGVSQLTQPLHTFHTALSSEHATWSARAHALESRTAGVGEELVVRREELTRVQRGLLEGIYKGILEEGGGGCAWGMVGRGRVRGRDGTGSGESDEDVDVDDDHPPAYYDGRLGRGDWDFSVDRDEERTSLRTLPEYRPL